MKVSMIVAAYNAEKYIEETLETLVKQTLDEYEILVVNDGSTDGTLEILRTYEERYPHLRVIDKENGGPSSARNAGLDEATGEYVFFFDADDLLEPDALEALYERAVKKKADIVIARYDIFNQYQSIPVNGINNLVVQDKIERYEPMILWTFSLCNKLFKRSLIENNQLRLPPISYSEDGAFLMQLVYRAHRITGLDMVIFHYRRMFEGEAESITASISVSKIRDYIEAHRIIFEAAEKSILIDYPSYATIEEAKKKNDEIHKYLSEIVRKELQILIDQFYSKYWSLDQETIQILCEEINKRIAMLDMRERSILQDGHPEISVNHLLTEPKEVLENGFFAVALYGSEECRDEFLNVVQTLTLQNLVGIEIWIPKNMEDTIRQEELWQGNFVTADVEGEEELFWYMLDHTKMPYITFADPKIAYANNAFKYAYKNFIKSPADFIIELVFHRNYGSMQAVLMSQVALNSVKNCYEYNECLAMDHLLANKFFRTEFLKSMELTREQTLVSQLPQMYRNAYFTFMNDGIVFFDDAEENYIDFVATEETRPWIEQYFENGPDDLNDPQLCTELTEIMPKMMQFSDANLFKIPFKKVISFLRRRPVKDQVLFFSIRKNGELEGNAKALYPYVEGKKVVCAKMLPHGGLRKIRMYYKMIRSRVIVTDDYNRYLRHFQLRRSQRVVQLWHACGAFKKFGQRGTNLSVFTDNATHAQYNLVSVSSDWIRPIYADAFDIDVHKVRALGCPRTDAFFDKEYIESTRQKVYAGHPELKGKQVIVYAPTFRDLRGDRSFFEPELDFARLSGQLKKDQMFVICPHPVMKNDIVDQAYDNIQVIRDFSTNDLMLVSDMLITDYSSVIFEYALLRRPIGFFCYDLTNYNRGFYLQYPDDLPGEVYYNQDELVSFIENPNQHFDQEKYEKFLNKYMSACDGNSSKRIAEVINKFMKESREDAGR